MGWMISVGTAGARGKRTSGQTAAVLSVHVEVQGTAARVKVFPDAGAIPALQAQRVWKDVLSTLVGN